MRKRRTEPDPYVVLGVDREASEEEVVAAYRKKAQEHHPDKGGDPAKFVPVARAKAILCCPRKRDEYDRTGNVESENAAHEKAAARMGNYFRQLAEAMCGGDVEWGADPLSGIQEAINSDASALEKHVADFRAQKKTLKIARRALRKKRKKKAGPGLPLWENTVDKMILTRKQMIEAADLERAVIAECQALLDSYEGVPEAMEEMAPKLEVGMMGMGAGLYTNTSGGRFKMWPVQGGGV